MLPSGSVAQSQTREFSWEPVAGPYGGITYQIVRDRAGRLFVGTMGGVFRSTDDGETWTSANEGMQYYTISSLSLDSSGNILAAAGGSGAVFYRSTNGGDSWRRVDSGLTWKCTSSYSAVAIEPDSRDIFFVTSEGLYRSSDGATWQRLDSLPFAYRLRARGGILYALQSINVYRYRRSTNYTAEKLDIPVPGVRAGALALGGNGTIYVGTISHGVFRSTDSGATWEQRSSGLNNEQIVAILVSPAGRIIAATISGVLFESTNDGESWSMLSNVGTPILDASFISDAHFTVAVNHGVLRTTDAGHSWTEQAQGMRAQSIRSLVPAPGNGLYAVTMFAEIYRTTDDGLTWASARGDLPRLSTPLLAVTHDGTLYLAQYSITPQPVFRSTDAGHTWRSVSGTLKNVNSTSLVAGDRGLVLLGSTRGVIYKTTNGGDNWTQLSTGATQNISRLAVDSLGGYWAGTDTDLYHSTDGGATWNLISLAGSRPVVAIGPGRQVLIASTDDTQSTVRLSGDGGVTWRNIVIDSVQRQGQYVPDIYTVVTGEPGTIVVYSVAQSIYLSRDNGGSWQRFYAELPQRETIPDLAVTSSGAIFAGTGGTGIFKLGGEDTTRGELPSGTRLNLPFPNPFRNTIFIPYDVAHPSHVLIEVYNTAGQRVDRLVNEEQDAGSYVIPWAAPYQANGYYFVWLRADGVAMEMPVELMR